VFSWCSPQASTKLLTTSNKSSRRQDCFIRDSFDFFVLQETDCELYLELLCADYAGCTPQRAKRRRLAGAGNCFNVVRRSFGRLMYTFHSVHMCWADFDCRSSIAIRVSILSYVDGRGQAPKRCDVVGYIYLFYSLFFQKIPRTFIPYECYYFNTHVYFFGL
jgi:hypothetical protein